MEGKGWYLGKIEWNDPKEKVPIPILERRISIWPDVKNGIPIPVLILDTSLRPDFENYIRFHILQKTGECKSSWGLMEGNLNLILKFLSPSRCILRIEFDFKKDLGGIDEIVNSEAVWICPARPGEKLAEILDPTRMLLVEVPSKEFRPKWEEILELALKDERLTKKQFRKLKEEWLRRFF